MSDVLYLCDRRACKKCSYPRCSHTRDIHHAKNFSRGRGGDYFVELESLPKGWMSAKEYLPPVKQKVLCMDASGTVYTATNWLDWEDGAISFHVPSMDRWIWCGHWMPFPELVASPAATDINVSSTPANDLYDEDGGELLQGGCE